MPWHQVRAVRLCHQRQRQPREGTPGTLHQPAWRCMASRGVAWRCMALQLAHLQRCCNVAGALQVWAFWAGTAGGRQGLHSRASPVAWLTVASHGVTAASTPSDAMPAGPLGKWCSGRAHGASTVRRRCWHGGLGRSHGSAERNRTQTERIRTQPYAGVRKQAGAGSRHGVAMGRQWGGGSYYQPLHVQRGDAYAWG